VADLTRRAFVKNSAGAAAGMTAIGALLAEQAQAHKGAGRSKPVIAYVSNPAKGHISLMSGKREVAIRDRKLAAQIVRAMR
jgi:hypothetical protein